MNTKQKNWCIILKPTETLRDGRTGTNAEDSRCGRTD